MRACANAIRARSSGNREFCQRRGSCSTAAGGSPQTRSNAGLRYSILPLSTAYTVCEGLGFESGVGKKFGEAPFFYWLYTLLIVAGGALVLFIPAQRLIEIVLWSQVLNGIVLPFVLIFMLLLINKKELMGEYTNTRLFNTVAWATTIIVIGLSVALMVASLSGKSG